MSLACTLDCHQTWIQPRIQAASGEVSKCYVAITDEFTENPHYWAETVDTYYFENGSYTITTRIDPGPHLNEGCPSVEVISTYDPDFDYGASTDDPSTSYASEVTPLTESEALAALVWGEWQEPGAEVRIIVADWHGSPFAISASLEVVSGGFSASVSASRQQWRQTRGYTALPMAITWDDDGTPGSITIPSGGAWSDTIAPTKPGVEPGSTERRYLTDPTFYAGRYIP